MVARLAVLAALVMVLPAFAGCTSDEPETVGPNRNVNPSPMTQAPLSSEPPPVIKPRSSNERWHFHDYWNGNPIIELMNATIDLKLERTETGAPAWRALVMLPNGVVVPPETGLLAVNVSWADPTPGPINVSFKPADSNDFFPGADLRNGHSFAIATTESMCDVPHRQESLWRFNLTYAPASSVAGSTPPQPAIPVRQVQLVVKATIGRPLFIDPPHLDWWQGYDVLPLIEKAQGKFVAAQLPGKAVAIPPPNPSALKPSTAEPPENVTVRVDEGSIVPEGTESLVVVLNWTSAVKSKLSVRYRESNKHACAATRNLR